MLEAKAASIKYDKPLEAALDTITGLLKGSYGISKRAVGLLLLQGDPEIDRLVKEQENEDYPAIQTVLTETRNAYGQPLSYVIALNRQQEVRRILSTTVTTRERRGKRLAERLSRAMMNPITGIPILLAVLYFGLYQFVGVLGAGTFVDFIESTVFGEWINPWAIKLFTTIIPFKVIQDLFVGEYGIITLGLSYAFAIILPIVGTFFIAFSIIEDSGYLPRLAMLIDRVFKAIGLNGRAVIPMVLGFGCDTMATIVTRTQETRRERVITTLLLALAIPCSAQLGVIFAILSGSGPGPLLVWASTVALILLLVGFLASRIIPGEKASFYMEIPPLRLPKLSNILVKTYTRLQWYFLEVLPLFLIASAMLWLGKLTGLFDIIISGIEPLVRLIGLPPQAAVAFLYGFFRRDFGAAGLYDLHSDGLLTGVPLVVAAVTLTLFIPCVAQFMVMLKERGLKTALTIAVFIFPFAFFVGYVLNLILTTLGVTL
ncbi:MAG: ferrous iron transporter B [Dehalococcoidales bacterium]|nr:ferrous iron transporter B [Dehalococcoidales bacterium]